MKRFLASALAIGALLMTLLTVAPAQAAYPGTVPASCYNSSLLTPVIKPGSRARVLVDVTTTGTARARGTVRLVLTRGDVRKVREVTYRGTPIKVYTARVYTGSWKLRVVFIPSKGSIYKRSAKDFARKVTVRR